MKELPTSCGPEEFPMSDIFGHLDARSKSLIRPQTRTSSDQKPRRKFSSAIPTLQKRIAFGFHLKEKSNSRDVVFYDEFEDKNQYEDIVCEETKNGRFKFSENLEDGPSVEETEIGPNNRNPEKAPTQGPVQGPVLEEEPIGNENLGAGLPTRRGPGRPKKIFSGRLGRPRKQYQMVIIIKTKISRWTKKHRTTRIFKSTRIFPSRRTTMETSNS